MDVADSSQERARRAELTNHPHECEACGACIFYEPRVDAEGYCAHPMLCLDVGSNWWCSYYERNQSSVKFAGHPLHPALIPFPLALTSVALLFDVLANATGRSAWRREANHALIAGTISGLVAAPVGLMDWLSLPTRRTAKPYGLVHGLGNLLLLGINGLNIGLRSRQTEPSPSRRTGEIALTLFANVLALGTGWLGGHLSYRHSVGVEPPTAPYRVLEVEPIARLSDQMELRDGRLQVPAESVWNGPVIPSEKLPSAPPEQHRAAG